MISAGLFNDRINLYAPKVDKGEYGGVIESWECVKHNLWARVQFQKGSMIIRQGDAMMSQTIAVTIRDNKSFSELMRIEWDGKMYRIDSFNRAKSEGTITITAMRIEDGEKEEE